MNETERIFDLDSSVRQFTATVLACEPERESYKIVLDRTAFFPGGGGQTCDIGILAGINVEKVNEKDGIIYHWMRSPLEVGTAVEGIVDWQKRFSDMQQHSGEHIVSGLMHNLFGFDNVGFRLGNDYVTMDFNGTITTDQLRMVEEKANEAVFKNLPIIIKFPSEQELSEMTYRSKKELHGRVKIVEIPGYDICACCAPHVAKTGDIGLVKLIHMERYKGGSRIYLLCGFRALADYNEKEKSVQDISALLSAKPGKVAEAVARQKEENMNLRQEINFLKMDIVGLRIASIPSSQKNVCLFDEHLDKTNMRRAWTMMTERFEGLCASFAGDDEKGYQFVLGGKDIDACECGKSFAGALKGKGGGSKEMYQGRVCAKKAEIEEWFSRYDHSESI